MYSGYGKRNPPASREPIRATIFESKSFGIRASDGEGHSATGILLYNDSKKNVL